MKIIEKFEELAFDLSSYSDYLEPVHTI